MRTTPARIGILAPMPSELRPVVKALGLRRRREPGPAVVAGLVGSTEVVATGTGIGPALAAEATDRLLGQHPVDHVVVSGIAGGIAGASAVGDLVIPAEVISADDGSRYRATPLGDRPVAGIIRTGGTDSYRLDRGELERLLAEGVVALDMETAAVARVCDGRGVPWTAFRGISDMAGDESVGEVVMTLVKPDGSPDLLAATRFFLRHPQRLPRMLRLGREAGVAAGLAARATRDAITAAAGAPG
jgi:adenosylhomocysteine nucleosidase